MRIVGALEEFCGAIWQIGFDDFKSLAFRFQ